MSTLSLEDLVRYFGKATPSPERQKAEDMTYINKAAQGMIGTVNPTTGAVNQYGAGGTLGNLSQIPLQQQAQGMWTTTTYTTPPVTMIYADSVRVADMDKDSLQPRYRPEPHVMLEVSSNANVGGYKMVLALDEDQVLSLMQELSKAILKAKQAS